ncbi:MAG TPA: bacteriohopanetetrol glucosamine biosynthesis glycosyltransferase HpnI [Steroidobacteraceae bacterium]|nr:bacteriohopanetetrol glucosamine biosynthesis glycosyltransferase HpnI [Steroidobacteraceae bacterium]
MTFTPHLWMFWCGSGIAGVAAVYAVAAVAAVRTRLAPDGGARPAQTPPVTILKPLCGDEHELYECLRSFCEQDYARLQIVFGVSDGADPAVAVVSRLQEEFPHIDIDLAIDRRQHGSSRKVSNLINMMPLARHDLLVISDSDVRVARDYLARIVPPLLDPQVGIVTCPYRGNPRRGLWSLLGSMFINDWFIPSVRVAAMCGSRAFAFGVTIALRRQVLARIGGFASIANQLADDYRLGELTRALGLRTVLSDVVVETCVDERSLGELLRHELRWLRTIRTVRPLGYCLSFVTFGVPMAFAGAVISNGAWPAVVLLAVTALARIMLHFRMRATQRNITRDLVLLPLRDVLSVALWGWGFVTRSVHWRDDRLRVTRDGSVQPVVRITQ